MSSVSHTHLYSQVHPTIEITSPTKEEKKENKKEEEEKEQE